MSNVPFLFDIILMQPCKNGITNCEETSN